VKPILRAAVALFRQRQQTRAALHSAEARLQERTIIDQAKARLILNPAVVGLPVCAESLEQ
jgi:AmiR/NasT family two-component response regulator